jgi:hypothetical protein
MHYRGEGFKNHAKHRGWGFGVWGLGFGVWGLASCGKIGISIRLIEVG